MENDSWSPSLGPAQIASENQSERLLPAKMRGRVAYYSSTSHTQRRRNAADHAAKREARARREDVRGNIAERGYGPQIPRDPRLNARVMRRLGLMDTSGSR